MGAGCYYTLPQNRDIKAYWLDIGFAENEDDQDYYDCEIDNLISLIKQLPLVFLGNDDRIYYGQHYEIKLESNYNGDGIVINLLIDDRDLNSQVYPLVLSNLSRVYRRIIRHINKSVPLRIATSGYTSALLAIGEIK
jgi:hypothetical protein